MTDLNTSRPCLKCIHVAQVALSPQFKTAGIKSSWVNIQDSEIKFCSLECATNAVILARGIIQRQHDQLVDWTSVHTQPIFIPKEPA